MDVRGAAAPRRQATAAPLHPPSNLATIWSDSHQLRRGTAGRSDEPAISVVICAYADRRWDDLLAAVASVRRQSRPARDIVVVIDHNPALLARARDEFGTAVLVVPNRYGRGLSGARNSGIDVASGDVVAFLDDDAVAETDWLELMAASFADERVVAVGGAIDPAWDAGDPRWLPEEFRWVVGCTYRGMPDHPAAVRNVIGANMAFRREVFDEVGHFKVGIGRVDQRPLGCEETELCIRTLQRWPLRQIVFDPRVRVRHRVPASRTRLGYYRARCYAEGHSKALVARSVGGADALATERAYTFRTLPAGVARGVRDSIVGGEPMGLVRAGAIVAGLAFTTAGYMAGHLTARRPGVSRSERDPAAAERAATRPSDEGRNSVQRAEGWINFNIHGLMTMRVAAAAPTAELLRDMFAPFVTDRPIERFDLTVTSERVPMHDPSFGETEYAYTDRALLINETDVQIVRDGDAFILNGTRELLVSALPLIDHILTTRGAAMVHAATVEYRGTGICMPAWGGTGKTSTIAKLLKRDGFAFMGDDWAFLTEDARLLAYAKPMFIKPHHRPIYPHLFAKRRKPLVPVRFSRPLGRMTTRVHPVVTRYPRFARKIRALTPEHMMVTPQAAFPHARFSDGAPLAAVVFVERFDGSRPELREVSEDWMVSRLIGNFNAEVTAHSRDVMTALGASGIVPIEQFFARKAGVFRQAIADKPTLLLRVPQSYSPDRASDVIVEHLDRIIVQHGVGIDRRDVAGLEADSLVAMAAALA